MTSDQDALKRAFAVLSSLKENLPNKHEIPEKYVLEYHRIVKDLAAQGYSLEEFKIPESEITRRLRSYNGMTDESTYSKEKYVERPFLMTKLDALLSYFSLVVDDSKPPIGFAPPQRG